jgi:hypothetical protein
METISWDVVRMRACYNKKGDFVSLICYSYNDEQAETTVAINGTKLTLSYTVTPEEQAKLKDKFTRFIYPNHAQFGNIIQYGKFSGMLPLDFKI